MATILANVLRARAEIVIRGTNLESRAFGKLYRPPAAITVRPWPRMPESAEQGQLRGVDRWHVACID